MSAWGYFGSRINNSREARRIGNRAWHLSPHSQLFTMQLLHAQRQASGCLGSPRAAVVVAGAPDVPLMLKTKTKQSNLFSVLTALPVEQDSQEEDQLVRAPRAHRPHPQRRQVHRRLPTLQSCLLHLGGHAVRLCAACCLVLTPD